MFEEIDWEKNPRMTRSFYYGTETKDQRALLKLRFA